MQLGTDNNRRGRRKERRRKKEEGEGSLRLTSCGGQRGSPGGLSTDMFQHTQANGLKEGGGKSSDRKEEEDNLFFWPYYTACGILVPRPGIEPVSPAVEVPRPNHWSTREVPGRISKDVQVLATWGRAPACL